MPVHANALSAVTAARQSVQVLSLQSLTTKLAGKLQRLAWRDHVAGFGKKIGEKKQWLAIVAVPAALLTAPINDAAQAEGFTRADMASFSQQRMVENTALSSEQSLSYQEEIDYNDPAANRSWVLYLGSGSSRTPQGEQFQAYWTEIHGTGLERVGSASSLGVGLRNTRATQELKLILFNSTAGSAEEQYKRADVVVHGDNDTDVDWIVALTHQIFGVDRGGIVGPFRYAPLSVSIGGALRGFAYYTYESIDSERTAFSRRSKRNWLSGAVWQVNLDLFNVWGNTLGVSYIDASSTIPANESSAGGFTRIAMMSLRRVW